MSLCRHMGTVMNKVARLLFIVPILFVTACQCVPPDMVLCKPSSFKDCRCWESPGLVDVSVCCSCEEDGDLHTFCVGGEG